MRLQGKVAIVTGASRGIGRVVAVAMAREGASVVVNGRTREPVNEVVAEIRGFGGQAVPSYDDVALFATGEALVDRALRAFGKLDILVNNAGIVRDALVHRMTEAQWDELMATNLKGVFVCTRAAAQPMIAQRNGRIISMTSATAKVGAFGQSNYAASKAAIEAFTKSCAKELGRYNITVNAVAPAMLTPMYERMGPEWIAAHFKERALARVPEPAEIPPVVIFLASDEASYITGQIVAVNGGLHIC